MLLYILKRLFIFIPTLFVISAILFYLSLQSNCDAAEATLGMCQESDKDFVISDADYRSTRKRLGVDKPMFYIELASLADSDTLYQIPYREHRKLLNRLTTEFGNWNSVSGYYGSLQQATNALKAISNDTIPSQSLVVLKDRVQLLYHLTKPDEINATLTILKSTVDSSNFSTIKAIVYNIDTHYKNLKTSATVWKTYVPMVFFRGKDNQYHTWASNFLRGEFGFSYYSKRPVSDEIGDRIYWTILSTSFATLITYLLAIPLGIYSARKRGTQIDNFLSTILFALHSLPSFWIGTLLIIFLCQPMFLNWFPPYGLGDASVAVDGWGVTISTVAYHLVLPVFCLTYSSIAFLSRQMRSSMLDALRQDYIRTAWAKGASESQVIWQHAFRNSLLPIITVFANVFPALVGGSIVIEMIFTLPGMGQCIFQAISSHDYPIIFTSTMLIALLTMLGNLVADILYAIVDPRIRFS